MAKQKATGVEYFQSANGEWYWRIRSPNGNIVGGSTEGYRRVGGAKGGFDALRAAIIAMDAPEAVKPPRKPRTIKLPAAPAEGVSVDAELAL